MREDLYEKYLGANVRTIYARFSEFK